MTIVAGLALAALGARQVRTAEALISREPGQTLLVGLAGLVVVPVIAILAMMTIIGAPLGLAILLVAWPAAAYAGYLVAGIWIGEWLIDRDTRSAVNGRISRPWSAWSRCRSCRLIPFLGAIASLFGFGAVLLMAWRTFRAAVRAQPLVSPPATQPMGI